MLEVKARIHTPSSSSSTFLALLLLDDSSTLPPSFLILLQLRSTECREHVDSPVKHAACPPQLLCRLLLLSGAFLESGGCILHLPDRPLLLRGSLLQIIDGRDDL
jgi:hypothetical protein